MFTNWLTSPSTTTLNNNTQTLTTSPYFGQLASNLMSTPPDIILEVGPSPSVRFVGHSSLLAMHSGYLRSAIRLDENDENLYNTISGLMEIPPIYLTNVTPEQFGPLLTYMYTGYLDLTTENIFGVLLATHILHMPRALEICRAFLATAQTEGFLNGNYLSQLNNSNYEINATKNSNVIRPIPSKPIISNLGFIVAPKQPISLPSTDTKFRSLSFQSPENVSAALKETSKSKILEQTVCNLPSSVQTLTSLNEKTCTSSQSNDTNENKINDTTKTSNLRKYSTKLGGTRSKTDLTFATPKIRLTKHSNDDNRENNDRNNQDFNTIEQDTENKIIIDVASCDGPVRFRKVLNDAYGRQPETVHIPPPQHERSHQSVSHSFHQQMAKNICQQRHEQQLQQRHSEESENSEDANNNSIPNQQGSSNSNTSVNGGEVFNCVYCKHTFKSQYCYQKHAKRHLNPLSLEQGDGIYFALSVTNFHDILKETKTDVPIPPEKINRKESTSSLSNLTASTNCNDTLEQETVNTIYKREVRPLDMNVQYYPCKTCGSKFPSYYFVHKHRKMCHANEEN